MKTSVKRRAKNCIRGTVLLACFIAVWYVASCFTQPLFIPAPATVWEAIVGLAETGQLQKGLAYSFLRITGASALSMLVAIPLSLLIYGVKPIKETIMPVVSFLRYVPVTAFSPLLILWFGIGEQMKISFLFIATFVYLLPSILLCFTGAWHKEPFYKTEDRLPLGHGEKSVIILQSFIKLTRDEIVAIRWHMGSFDCAVKGGDYGMGNAFETYPLAVMTHLADMEATYLVEGLATK